MTLDNKLKHWMDNKYDCVVLMTMTNNQGLLLPMIWIYMLNRTNNEHSLGIVTFMKMFTYFLIRSKYNIYHNDAICFQSKFKP
jgi:hypothetical protein